MLFENVGIVRIYGSSAASDCNEINWQLKCRPPVTPAFNSKEEDEIARKYPAFFNHATRGERAVLVAISLLRNLVLTSDSTTSIKQTATALKPLLPQYAAILRTTEVWNKLTEKERLSIEHDLLNDA